MTCFLYSSLYLAVRQDSLPFHPYRSRCWRFRYGCSRRGWLHRQFVSGRSCWRRRCCHRCWSFLDRGLHAACRDRLGHRRSRIHRVPVRFIPCRRLLDDGLDGRRPFFRPGQAEGIPAAPRRAEGRDHGTGPQPVPADWMVFAQILHFRFGQHQIEFALDIGLFIKRGFGLFQPGPDGPDPVNRVALGMFHTAFSFLPRRILL